MVGRRLAQLYIGRHSPQKWLSFRSAAHERAARLQLAWTGPWLDVAPERTVCGSRSCASCVGRRAAPMIARLLRHWAGRGSGDESSAGEPTRRICGVMLPQTDRVLPARTAPIGRREGARWERLILAGASSWRQCQDPELLMGYQELLRHRRRTSARNVSLSVPMLRTTAGGASVRS
jgi:hypothetical protein